MLKSRFRPILQFEIWYLFVISKLEGFKDHWSLIFYSIMNDLTKFKLLNLLDSNMVTFEF